jgi:hypothetical protein
MDQGCILMTQKELQIKWEGVSGMEGKKKVGALAG